MPALIKQFIKRFEKVHGHGVRLQNLDEVADYIVKLLPGEGTPCIAVAPMPNGWDTALAERLQTHATVLAPPYTGDDIHEPIGSAHIGITAADFGIAETGTLVEFSADDAIRLVSSLPRTHVAILLHETIVPTLTDAAPRLRRAFEDHPNGFTASFLSGPSRTGDIELILTLGVHGPENAHAIVLDPRRPSQ